MALNAGASYTLTASRTLSTTDPTGSWYAYATYQDSSGVWHDGPSVYFTVTSPPSDAGTGGGGTDAGSGGGTDAGSGGGADAGSGAADGGLSLHVSGNRIADGNGAARQLRGVNRSGTEYACIQGWGIFDGPSDEASVQAIASWHTTSVRVPLNEDCWLNINGVNPAYGGANYQSAIAAFVQLLHKYGLYAELELHWSAAGSAQATGQAEMPNQDHSVAFWSSVASYFKGDPAVFFGTFNEPYGIGWSCWANGGSSCSLGYAAAGQQSLVNAIRQAGATQPITLSGIDYANTMTSWLQYKPTDPLGQLIAEAHVYGNNSCDTTTCFNQEYAPVLLQVPMIWGETGEDYAGSDYSNSFISQFLPWADANHVSYQGWAWDTWGGSLQLISSYSGAVNTASGYAVYFQSHLSSLAGQP